MQDPVSARVLDALFSPSRNVFLASVVLGKYDVRGIRAVVSIISWSAYYFSCQNNTTGWAISLFLSTNGLRKQSSSLQSSSFVGPVSGNKVFWMDSHWPRAMLNSLMIVQSQIL